jgi:hypothetical protein
MIPQSEAQRLTARAFFRVQFRIIGRSENRRHRLSTLSPFSNLTSVAFVAYRSGQRLKDKELGLTFDYRNRIGIYHTEIIAPPDAPQWVFNRAKLWNAVQEKERRKDAQLCRECLISLPKELGIEDCKQLVVDYVREVFVSAGMVADIAIHEPSHNPERGNIHAHVLLTMRTLENDQFGLKVRDWSSKSNAEHWRAKLCELTNLYLERAGLELRVNHKSRARLELEQGLHVDYSAPYEILDVEPELLLDHSHQLEADPLEDRVESMPAEEGKGALEERNESISPDRNHPATLGEEAFETDHTAFEFHQFHHDILSLTAPKTRIELSDDQRLLKLHQLELQLEDRLKELEAMIANHPDPQDRERFQLQAELEKSFFLARANQFKLFIHTQKGKRLDAVQLLPYRRKARLSEKAYQTYVSEWGRRAVRDPRYFTIEPKLTLTVERVRAQEEKRWTDFQERALKFDWNASKIAQEARILQQWLDKELNRTLERTLGLDLDLGLGR